ncbi:hypothetical protein [Actinoallomurus acanthiterrae]
MTDVQLSRSDLGCPGIRRIRCGRGFRYVDPDGKPIRGAETLTRLRALVIPPAWDTTVLAAVGLAVSEPAAAADGTRKRAVARVVREVADYLGNTPAVARASYIDPRVIELYERGITIAPALGRLGENRAFGDLATRGPAERAVLELLTEHG